MKNAMIFIISVIVLSACKHETNLAEINLKHHFILGQMIENDRAVEKFSLEATGSGNSVLLQINEDVNRISSWRKKYLTEKSTASLIAYSDSILSRYQKITPRDKQIEDEILSQRAQVLQARDSSSTLNLFLWSLCAEAWLLDDKNNGTIFCDFSRRFQTTLNQTTFATDDTVLVLINAINLVPDTYDFNFRNVYCKNLDTNKTLQPKTIKLGGNYLLRYLPREPGKHIVGGAVAVSLGEYTDHFSIMNEFTVQ
jgi:hypothetical protein